MCGGDGESGLLLLFGFLNLVHGVREEEEERGKEVEGGARGEGKSETGKIRRLKELMHKKGVWCW